jgi:hypothetical protein
MGLAEDDISRARDEHTFIFGFGERRVLGNWLFPFAMCSLQNLFPPQRQEHICMTEDVDHSNAVKCQEEIVHQLPNI